MISLMDYWRIYRARGILRVCHEFIENGLYDLIHKTDTQQYRPIKNYKSKNQKALQHAVQYQPAYRTVIKHAFEEALKLIDMPGSFLDIGSGKGKVLIESMRYPFTKIYGVEIEKELCEIAESNIKRVAKDATNYEVIHSDIQHFTFPKDLSLVFLFNPFDEVLTKQVFKRLEDFRITTNRKLMVIYVNPLYLHLLSNVKILQVWKKKMQDSVLLEI